MEKNLGKLCFLVVVFVSIQSMAAAEWVTYNIGSSAYYSLNQETPYYSHSLAPGNFWSGEATVESGGADGHNYVQVIATGWQSGVGSCYIYGDPDEEPRLGPRIDRDGAASGCGFAHYVTNTYWSGSEPAPCRALDEDFLCSGVEYVHTYAQVQDGPQGIGPVRSWGSASGSAENKFSSENGEFGVSFDMHNIHIDQFSWFDNQTLTGNYLNIDYWTLDPFDTYTDYSLSGDTMPTAIHNGHSGWGQAYNVPLRADCGNEAYAHYEFSGNYERTYSNSGISKVFTGQVAAEGSTSDFGFSSGQFVALSYVGGRYTHADATYYIY